MEFKTAILQLGEKSARLKDVLKTEESVKTAIILPFLQALGYDVFDPSVIMPEFIADVGTKKGEKVDYAILDGEQLKLLIECKPFNESLGKHGGQLFRYYTVSRVRFGLITNGLVFRFFADIDASNIMDNDPFFEFNITALSDEDIETLEWFHNDYFDEIKVLEVARQMKYAVALKRIMQQEIQTPSVDFLKFWIGHIYGGKLTEKALRDFSPMVTKALRDNFKVNY